MSAFVSTTRSIGLQARARPAAAAHAPVAAAPLRRVAAVRTTTPSACSSTSGRPAVAAVAAPSSSSAAAAPRRAVRAAAADPAGPPAGQVSSELMTSMEGKIRDALEAQSVRVQDMYGDGRHVSIDVVAAAFEGKSSVARQRLVYKVGAFLHAVWACHAACTLGRLCRRRLSFSKTSLPHIKPLPPHAPGDLARAAGCGPCGGRHDDQDARGGRVGARLVMGTPPGSERWLICCVAALGSGSSLEYVWTCCGAALCCNRFDPGGPADRGQLTQQTQTAPGMQCDLSHQCGKCMPIKQSPGERARRGSSSGTSRGRTQ
jgi:stress-induced morphogen